MSKLGNGGNGTQLHGTSVEHSCYRWTQETGKQTEEGFATTPGAQAVLEGAKSWEMLLAEE